MFKLSVPLSRCLDVELVCDELKERIWLMNLALSCSGRELNRSNICLIAVGVEESSGE